MKARWFASRFVLTAVLLVTALTAAHALWLEWQVTPDNRKAHGREFAITAQERDGLTEIKIVVTPYKEESAKAVRDISPFLNATLSVIDHDKWVASTPLAERRESGKVTYRFRISASAAAESKFEFNEGNYVPLKNGKGAFPFAKDSDRKVERIMGGTAYWFWLRDFTSTK